LAYVHGYGLPNGHGWYSRASHFSRLYRLTVNVDRSPAHNANTVMTRNNDKYVDDKRSSWVPGRRRHRRQRFSARSGPRTSPAVNRIRFVRSEIVFGRGFNVDGRNLPVRGTFAFKRNRVIIKHVPVITAVQVERATTLIGYRAPNLIT